MEIFYNGNWGTVCDDDWDKNDARVVCRQLGFFDADSAPGSAHFGSGSGHIWLDDVGCSGGESSIVNCQHKGWGVENCVHSEDASVICSGNPSSSNANVFVVNVLFKLIYCCLKFITCISLDWHMIDLYFVHRSAR